MTCSEPSALPETHDGPAAYPLGPTAIDPVGGLATPFAKDPAISRVRLANSGRRLRGPVVAVIEPAADVGTTAFLEAVDRAAARAEPAGGATEVSPGPDGQRYNPEAIPPDATIGATVRMWIHPFASNAADALRAHDAVASYEIAWDPDFSTLFLDARVISWEDVADLAIGVEFADDAGDEAVDAVTRALRAGTVADYPEAYIVGVEQADAEPDSADAIYSLGFEQRDELADARSRVYAADGEALPTAIDRAGPAEDVQLTITSPPYLDAIDYDAHAAAGDAADWTGRAGDQQVAAWMDVQEPIFQSVFDATREGGYCAVVIGTVKREKGRWSPLPHHFADVMQEIGWTFHERVIWNKVTGGAPRFGTTVQNPYPSYYYPNQQHEEIQIWRKGDIVNRRDEASKLQMTDLMKQEIANNVWHIAPTPMNAAIDHPCPFPEEIAHRLTLLYSCNGDVVADPMAGSGTTLKVADRLDRVAVGTEIRTEYVAEARRRLATERYDRRDQLLPEFPSVEPVDERATHGRGPLSSIGAVDEGVQADD